MPEQPSNDEQAEIKKRAMQRLAVAASLVAAAVVALTVLNYKKPEQTQAVTTSTAPAPEQATPHQPEAATEKPQEEEKPGEAAAHTPPAPEAAATPVPLPPPPQVINRTEPPAAPGRAKPRAETPPVLRITQEPGPQAPKPAKPAATTAPQQPAPAASAAAEQKPPVEARQPPKQAAAEPLPPKAYAVQLGLFSNPENALQLQKRLAEHGIQSHTETRLQVGPFQTRAEAEQALARIRALGINAVLAPAR
jgi:DedD protein